jgi:multidrug efflux pump subunit AcrA (membrane-fusion protein)
VSKIPDDGSALFPVATSQAQNAGDVAYYHQWHMPVPLRFSARSRFALRCSFVALLGGFVWAVTVPIGGAFMAQGRLVADGRNQIVDTLEGGMVQTVFFKEGDKVKSGDLLARMDVTNASVTLANASHQRDINRIKLVRLLAEQNDLPQFRWPKDLAALIERDSELADTAKTNPRSGNCRRRTRSSSSGSTVIASLSAVWRNCETSGWDGLPRLSASCRSPSDCWKRA